MNDKAGADFSDRAAAHLKAGNLAQAEVLARTALARTPGQPRALNLLGLVAWRIGKLRFARDYFRQAQAAAPGHDAAGRNLAQIEPLLAALEKAPAKPATGPRYLLIKAWGYGFWSDIDHVLGQLLLAEITARTPVVHWGRNSLFRAPDGDRDSDAFSRFFQPVSAVSIDDLARPGYRYFPPKWNAGNLRAEELNKWGGPHSRMAALHYLARDETVAVSDFRSGIVDIAPWIEPGHPYHGMSVAALYRQMIRRHIRPVPAVAREIDAFHARCLAGAPYLAAHVRGADKIGEQPELEQINALYPRVIERLLAGRPWPILLLTDANEILARFQGLYGDRLVHTDCQRTDGRTGVHYRSDTDRARLGIEAMVDTYLAARAELFVGNGMCNLSCMVGHLADWPAGRYELIGSRMHERPNRRLHER